MKKTVSLWKNRIGSDNRGLSLVELLVAITIGAIVSGSIASLLVFSLRMYGEQTVDVEMQQEIQTTSNFVIDAIMESNSFIVSKTSDRQGMERTDVAILGKFEYASSLSFTGYVFCIDNVASSSKEGKLYMKKYTSESLPTECINTGEIVPDKIVEKLSNGVAGQNTNLLATNVQLFNLTQTTDSISGDKYNNPFSVEFDIQFAKSTGPSDVKKELHDTIAIRNALKAIKKETSVEMTPVCIKSVGGIWNMYYQPAQVSKGKEDDFLKITTETVEMEKSLGMIQTGGNSAGLSYKILEIVPDYSYDYIQYAIGGTNGGIICDEKYRHYGDESFRKLKDSDVKKMNVSNIYPNLHANNLKLIITPNESKSGKWLNNELFKLYILEDYLNTSGTSLHSDCGIWDIAKDDYCTSNQKVISEWHEAGNCVELYVCTPSDLDKERCKDWIDKANMIVFGQQGDGGFNWAHDRYMETSGNHNHYNCPNALLGTTGGDLSWENTRKIYKRVLNEEICIACPENMNNSTIANLNNTAANINYLFTMLYWFKNTDISAVDDNIGWGISFLSDISNGSGRDLFMNVETKEEVQELISVVYSQTYYRDDNSARPDLFNYKYDWKGGPNKYRNQLIYSQDSSILTFYKDGSKGLLGLRPISQSANSGLTPSEPEDVEPTTFGNIEIAGVSLDGDNGRYVPGVHGNWGPWGWLDYTYPQMKIHYQIDAVKLNNPVSVKDKETGKTVEIDKVIYLNEYEYEYAKYNESRVFCIVDCTDIYNSLFINKRCVPVNFDQFGLCPFKKCEHKTGIASTYKPEDGQKVNDKEVIKVLECQIDMKIVDDNKSTGVFDNYIKITAVVDQSPDLELDAELIDAYAKDRPIFPGRNKDVAMGTDYALVVVRDLFDLD